MDSPAVAERASSFPSPRPHPPPSGPEGSPSSTSTYTLSAQRHTLSRLQAFFASHRFDTEGPYDDLFVVLLSTARHLVDVCEAQAAQLQRHEQCLSRTPREDDGVSRDDDVEGRVAAVELRADRLSQQLVRLQARQTLTGTLAAPSPISASVAEASAGAETVYDRSARAWELGERLDSVTAAQAQTAREQARASQHTAAVLKRLQDDQQAQATWSRAHLAELEARLTSLEAQAERHTADSTTAMTTATTDASLASAAGAVAQWRAQKQAHPLLHPVVLARLFGDDAAAVRFTDDVHDRLEALEAASRGLDVDVAHLHAGLAEREAAQVVHAQLVEARLTSTDQLMQALARHVAEVSDTVDALARRRSPSRRRADDRSEEGAENEARALPAPLHAADTSLTASAHRVSVEPARGAGHGPLRASPSKAAHHPYNADNTSRLLHLTPGAAVSDEDGHDRVSWSALAAWLEDAVEHAAWPATHADTSLAPARAKVALVALCHAAAASAPVPALPVSSCSTSSSTSSRSGAMHSGEDLPRAVAVLADELNTCTGRLGVLEAYSPHTYAVAARPPVLGVELEDVVPHPEEPAQLPECLGTDVSAGVGGVGGGVRVVRVFAGYPASFAGFAAGDVVVAVQGHTVRHRAELFACLTEHATAHRARCQVRLEDAFLRSHSAVETATTTSATRSPASRAALVSPFSSSSSPATKESPTTTTTEAWRAWQLEALLPRQEIQFTLWRRGQFIEVGLLVPASPEPSGDAPTNLP